MYYAFPESITDVDSIIAIMLGRLEMDVDECLRAYASMFKRVFGKKGLPTTLRGEVKGRFDSIVLKDCIREILRDRRLPADEPLLNSREDACKVYVYVLIVVVVIVPLAHVVLFALVVSIRSPCIFALIVSSAHTMLSALLVLLAVLYAVCGH